jgi:hypothetical protein
MALAQRKAPGRNETAGALEVLDLLCLEGCVVTADALHCHRAFASAVLQRGGDYVLAIKANRGMGPIRAHFGGPPVNGGGDPTAWLGISDSNSERPRQIIPLKGRADFRDPCEFYPPETIRF